MTEGAGRLRVTFWGPLTDAMTEPERSIAVRPGLTAGDVAADLGAAAPELAEALRGKGVLIMADDTLIDAETDVSNARELAFMSPMSGG